MSKKLIIELDDIDYQHIKENMGNLYHGATFKAIREGIPLENIIEGLESHKWGKKEGSKEIYDKAIDDAITYIEESTMILNNVDIER